MSGRRPASWRRAAAVLLLALASVAAAETPVARGAWSSARVFTFYFRALENSRVPVGFWQRVALSLMLASADSPKAACARDNPGAPRS
jgi:hypothetical protein